MKSPDYKLTPKGYVLTYTDTPLNSDPSKQLPIYRIVSEFMNLPEQEEPISSQEEPNNKVSVDITKSQISEQDHVASEIRYLSRNQSRFNDKEEIKSIYTVE